VGGLQLSLNVIYIWTSFFINVFLFFYNLSSFYTQIKNNNLERFY